jgi:RHS repeat-associated protein
MGGIRMAMVDVSGNSIYYYLNDHLGTPQRMTDETNTVVWEASYMPFGEAWVNPNSGVTNNIRFPGQYEDQESGLHYNFHRYYDPHTGRYLRPDPIHTMQPTLGNLLLFSISLKTHYELNSYHYAQNNPLKMIDPKGLVCGSGWTEWIVPDTPTSYAFNFSGCCQKHDDCYGTECNMTREQCDDEFYKCLSNYCKDHEVFVQKCLKIAAIYWSKVRKYGQNAFDNAREKPPCGKCEEEQ